MKHPLPQAFPRRLLWIAVAVVFFVAIPAAAQNSGQGGNHAQAVLHIEAYVASYAMPPGKNPAGNAGSGSVAYSLPTRLPAMSVIEETRVLVGSVAIAGVQVDAGQGAVLKTLTIVPR